MNQSNLAIPSENIRRILVVKLRAIGDVLLSTPVIQNLHYNFPDAKIDFLVEKFASGVVVGNPWISEVLEFDRAHDAGLTIIRAVRGRHYDLIVDLFCNPRSAIITWLSGAPVRVGYPFRWRRYAYNVSVAPRGGEVHNVEFNLDALRRMEIPVRFSQPILLLDESSKRFADSWFSSEALSGKEIVGLNPSGGWSTKRWGLEHYARLGDKIAERFGSEIVLLWGPGEEQDIQAIKRSMKSPAHVIPMCSLLQLAALIHRCDFVVSNDSGPMHIAASLQIPTLGIFGPTDPRLQGPYGDTHHWVRNEALDCLGCNLTMCPIGNICMTQLEVGKVLDAIELLVAKSRSETIEVIQ